MVIWRRWEDRWMYVCMYVWMDGWMDGWLHACMHVCHILYYFKIIHIIHPNTSFSLTCRVDPVVLPFWPAEERVKGQHNVQPGGGAIGIEVKTSIVPAAGPKLSCVRLEAGRRMAFDVRNIQCHIFTYVYLQGSKCHGIHCLHCLARFGSFG